MLGAPGAGLAARFAGGHAMTLVSYAGATIPVRDDLVAAHDRAWVRLASAGTWWTGAERIAIAAAVREAARCRLCHDRTAALSPASVAGEHDGGDGGLPASAVDAVHRIASDPARLTRKWFEATLTSGLGEGRYVELLAVVATLVSIDAFCRAIGAPLHPLPAPRPGEPRRQRPLAARKEDAWVAMLPQGRPEGAEADLWDGRTGNVIRALSLVPDEVRALKDLSRAHYLTLEEMSDPLHGRGALDRRQVELLAARVSALRECFY
jgi:hypothetical protein